MKFDDDYDEDTPDEQSRIVMIMMKIKKEQHKLHPSHPQPFDSDSVKSADF